MEASIEIQEALENDVQDASVVQETVPVHSQKGGIAAPKKRRMKLLLAPRTKPMEPSVSTPTNPVFGGAKPVDTAAKDKEIEERINRENGTIPKYPKVEHEIHKFISSVIGKSFRLSSNLYKNDNRLVPCCKPPILKKQHNCELRQQCNTLQNKSNGSSKKTKKKQLTKEKKSSRCSHLSANSKDDSESKQEMVKKTLGKTQKRKQNQTDKIVSFQIPGKNTPDKNSVTKEGTPIPNKNEVAKKQATPSKTKLKEFKELLASDSAKKNGKQSKKQEESDDDNADDDNENMDDDADTDFLFDLDMLLGRENDEDNGGAEDDADLDMLIGGEDDADRDVLLGGEDDADRDVLLGGEDYDELDLLLGNYNDDLDDMLLGGDDDEEDNDEDKEEEQISAKKNQSKQSQTPSSKKEQSFAQNKTPTKNAGNTVIKEKKTPKDKNSKKSGKTPEKTVDKSPEKQVVAKNVQNQKGAQTAESNKTPKAVKEARELAEERIRDRDSRTLFIGALPGDITPTEVKSLSNDIINVTIPRLKDKKKRKFTYAFTDFVSETKAEENYKILKSKKLRGQPITVDYAGHKRQNQKGEPVLDPQNMNMKKLYVSNLPLDTTIDKVTSMFPKAFQIQLNKNSIFRAASINFHTEELAAEAMTASKDFKINGLPMIVLYSYKKSQQKKEQSKKQEESDDDDANPGFLFDLDMLGGEDNDNDDDNGDKDDAKLDMLLGGETVDKSPEENVKKNVQNQKGAQTDESNETPKAFKEARELEEGIRDRDSRTLCIGTLPKDITPTEVLSLSNDIKNVIFPRMKNKNKRKFIYAFTEFVSETEAEKNYKILKRKKLRGQPITVDYAGHKSQNQKGEPVIHLQNRNMKVLRVPKLPIDTTVDKVASMFPEAFQIQVNKNSAFRSARIHFLTEELAAEAMTASKDFKINGLPVRVLYSKKRGQQKKRGKKSNGKNQQKEANNKNKLEHRKKLQKIKQRRKHKPQKKAKLEIKQEREDENQPQKKIKLEIKQEREDEE